MFGRKLKLQIGMRTIKTVAAVIISMLSVEMYGTTDSRLIFAMLGATAAMEPTFNESLRACITQVVGVFFGAVMGVILQALPLPPLVGTGVGIVMVITLYNAFGIRFSPSLPIFIVVTVCITPDIQPVTYALGRIWDSAIGLGVGLLINTLVFPYDNSRQIRATMRSLDREVIEFLENTFDGDDELPDAEDMSRRIDDMARQLTVFSNQRLVLRRRSQQQDLRRFRLCEEKARDLVAHMEVLSHIGRAGCLSEDNRSRLAACGAKIGQGRTRTCGMEENVVSNYHVRMILDIRQELLEALEE